MGEVCSIVVCVFKENYINSTRFFDLMGGMEFEILVTLPMVFLSRHSSLDWTVALVRQNDTSKHHKFYDSAYAADPLLDLEYFPNSLPDTILAST